LLFIAILFGVGTDFGVVIHRWKQAILPLVSHHHLLKGV